MGAVRGGQRPKPAALKLVTGNPGKREIPEAEFEVRETPLEPPRKLSQAQRRLWDRFINTAWWLTEHDVPKAFAWVALQAEFEKSPAEMVASRIANLRALGSELCLDSSARARAGIGSGKKSTNPAARFFD